MPGRIARTGLDRSWTPQRATLGGDARTWRIRRLSVSKETHPLRCPFFSPCIPALVGVESIRNREGVPFYVRRVSSARPLDVHTDSSAPATMDAPLCGSSIAVMTAVVLRNLGFGRVASALVHDRGVAALVLQKCYRQGSTPARRRLSRPPRRGVACSTVRLRDKLLTSLDGRPMAKRRPHPSNKDQS